MIRKHFHCYIAILLLLTFININAQSVAIKEEIMALDTYGFGKPNPVPILAENPKIPPYYKYEEYEHVAKKKNWKVITLENDFIKVFILPEIGGKVWGAIEKTTGEEFLYKNEVIKFRNIAMRGPWTSGGIEFNFGIIGHHPSTATPVNYLKRTNADGSVSCIVGDTDLPSNTYWTVEIRLEEDKAYFETNATWYNASSITQSYYNWMTAAAVATYDLEFSIPGNTYVEHNGNAHNWPIDAEARDLSKYKNNTFGLSKSYHIVGEYNDFFGGYYHDKKFGFGQWAPYEEMPGQKLWLWDLSRGGGIWEDLLTDSDGQYIEFQAGRLFDQYSAGAINPISQVGFDPYTMDTWSEIWFPFKEIGGMEDASKHGVLNVKTEQNQTYIGLNALQNLSQNIEVIVNGEKVLNEKLSLKPMEIYSNVISASNSDKVEVIVKGTELYYTNDPSFGQIKRPFYPDENLIVSNSEELFQEGIEAMEFREFSLAHTKLAELLNVDPSHRAGYVKMAELEYRRTNYELALQHINTVLKMDTYDSGANYLAGITYRALDDSLNALESLGWAARDMKYRSVSYAQMAEIHMALKNYDKAKIYANKALINNMDSVNAREILLILSRINNDKDAFNAEMQSILEIDPLNILVDFELAKMNNSTNQWDGNHLQNEFKDESILNLAIKYYNLGLDKDAISVLRNGPQSTKNILWTTYLTKGYNELESKSLLQEAINNPIDFVFPYRAETIPVLKWAVQENKNWKLKYYLAQNYLSIGRQKEGMELMESLGEIPDSDIFYRFRGALESAKGYVGQAKDFRKALLLNKSDWKVWEEIIQFYLKHEKYKDAHELSQKASKMFKGNYNIELAHAKALLNMGFYKEVVEILNQIQLLPYEHASESRAIYVRGHLAMAGELLNKGKYNEAISVLLKSKEWPENIGVGKPYSPDERIQDYLLAYCYEQIKDSKKQEQFLREIIQFSQENANQPNLNNFFGLLALKKLGEQQELEALLKETQERNSDKDALAMALYNKNERAYNMLLQKLNVPTDTQKILFDVLKH